MPAMTAAEVTALADTLRQAATDVAKTAASLEQRIATEGLKVGNKLGVQHAKAADERIRDNAAELQRAQDLAAELRRQRKVLDRRSSQYAALEKRIQALADESRKRDEGVPADVLYGAITEARAVGRQDPNQTAPKPVRIDKEN